MNYYFRNGIDTTYKNYAYKNIPYMYFKKLSNDQSSAFKRMKIYDEILSKKN